ncbi:MAG: hypothetical protein JXR25_00315 [Pontiellaceae bacterium]|nr:hypothetical protein [Pontiellaceae bacterium]MBN2783242.1 hypothetical protein [Pontiellaceae bacterium]
MTDYTINLARSLTASPEERRRFYRGMMVYLSVCGLGLTIAAYFLAVNLSVWWNARQDRERMLSTAVAVSGLSRMDFDQPEDQYLMLKKPSSQVESLEQLLKKRVQLVPVVYNLFAEMPEGVVLQSLVANKEKMAFGLVLPQSTASESGDPVRSLSTVWEKNDELMRRVKTIRPVTGERRTSGSNSVFFVQFECTLN